LAARDQSQAPFFLLRPSSAGGLRWRDGLALDHINTDIHNSGMTFLPGYHSMPSYREQLLTEGLRIIHERGFGMTSVADIIDAAGTPPESFAMHFASKEDFGMQMLDIYHANSRETIAQTLRDDLRPPLDRLRHYLALNLAHLERDGMRNGCLYGNLSAEGSDHGELIRSRIVEIFDEVREALAYCLRAGAQCGEVRAPLEYDEVANFAVASLQGAILLSKAQRDPGPVQRFEKMFLMMVAR
jgi:TetR/AcrR family transcriptional repressor of nem operon